MTRRVLVVGGLDPSGGAGITADARTLLARGAFALPVATVLTVQNRHGVTAVAAVDRDLWRGALGAALADGEVHAVKIGMLANREQVADLAELLGALTVPLVVDPVLGATAGGWRPPGDLAAAYRQHLVPRATVLTPNLPELALLAADGGTEALLALGCTAVLVKGGHGAGDGPLRDELVTPGGRRQWRHRRLPVGPVHGTGCALASVLAAALASGAPLEDAATAAIDAVQQGLAAMGPPAADGLPRPFALAPAADR